MRADTANNYVRKNRNFSNQLVPHAIKPDTAVSQPEIENDDKGSLHAAVEAVSHKKRRRQERKIFNLNAGLGEGQYDSAKPPGVHKMMVMTKNKNYVATIHLNKPPMN